MPLVIDPNASHCDVCLENYEAGSEVTPVVLACGHALCKNCSNSLGSSCHLCRSWFNRDRIIKLHVDYGRDATETGPAFEVAKDMETRAADVSTLQDIPAVREEIEQILDWLSHQSQEKYMLLRSYCELVLKLCTTMESKMHYKERYRSTEMKLRDCVEDSEARIRDLMERQVFLESELSVYRKNYDNDLDDDLMSIRNANPLPQPPQPVFYGTPPSRSLDTEYIDYTLSKPLSQSAPFSKSRSSETSNGHHKSARSPTRSHSKHTRKHQDHSGSSSRQRSDTEVPQPPRTSQRRSHEHSRPQDNDEGGRNHASSNRRYDALGQDPQRMFSRSQSQDNIAEQHSGPHARPKPRSSSYGQNGSTHPSNSHLNTGPRRASNESTRQHRDSERVNLQYSSSIRFPGSHGDNIEGMPSESLSTSSRPRKLSNPSITSAAGPRILGRQSSSTARASHQHQHQTVLHPINVRTNSGIPSSEQLGPRSRKPSLQVLGNPSNSGPSHPTSGNGRPITTVSNTYTHPTTSAVAQSLASPNIATYSTTTPWPNASKPLPPKPGPSGSEIGSGIPFPEPHVQSQIHSQPQASGSVSGGFRVTQAPMSANMVVDPNTIPQENITIHSSHSPVGASTHPPITVALSGRRSASGGTSGGNSPNTSILYGTTPIYQQHSMSNPNLNHQPQSQTHSSQHRRSSSTSRNPDTILYPRSYTESTMSDTVTAAMSTRTPRLRRTSGTRALAGGGASRPTTPGFANVNSVEAEAEHQL